MKLTHGNLPAPSWCGREHKKGTTRWSQVGTIPKLNVQLVAGLEPYFSRWFAGKQTYFDRIQKFSTRPPIPPVNRPQQHSDPDRQPQPDDRRMFRSTADLAHRSLRTGWNQLSPLIFPPVCGLCGEIVVSGPPTGPPPIFCDPCETSISATAPLMRSQCRDQWESARPSGFRFANVIAYARYDDAVKDAVVAAKYPRNTVVTVSLAKRLAGCCRNFMEFSSPQIRWHFVTHVPSHPWRRLRRGGSGTRVLAEAVAEELSLPSRLVLRSARRLAKQAWMDESQRRANVLGAFGIVASKRISRQIVGANVLLVDDVMTTGATADEIAGVLIDHGAARVDLAVVASAIRGRFGRSPKPR